VSFRFSLQPVMRLRESLERRERMRLLLLGSQITQMRQRLQGLEQEKETVRQQLSTQLMRGIAGTDFCLATSEIAAFEQRKDVLARQIVALEEKRREQQNAYQEAQRQRKILDNLRDRYLQTYRLEQSRRQQQQVDDLFMLRRRRITDV